MNIFDDREKEVENKVTEAAKKSEAVEERKRIKVRELLEHIGYRLQRTTNNVEARADADYKQMILTRGDQRLLVAPMDPPTGKQPWSYFVKRDRKANDTYIVDQSLGSRQGVVTEDGMADEVLAFTK